MKSLFLFLVLVFYGLYFDKLNIFRICIISSVLHEVSHAVTYRIIIKRWPKIKISIFGFSMVNDVYNNKYYPLILFAGPGVNLSLAMIAFVKLTMQFTMRNYVTLIVNTIIFIFNILPVYYLDGGQILYCISSFYRRFYIQISCTAIILFSVMVIYFTSNILFTGIFLVYFLINLSQTISFYR